MGVSGNGVFGDVYSSGKGIVVDNGARVVWVFFKRLDKNLKGVVVIMEGLDCW